MKNTTLCYIENERGEYLMLHRVKKQNDLNHDKWIGVGGKFEPFESQWEGDKLFLALIHEPETPFFSMKLQYAGDTLVYAALNGKELAV